MLLCVVFAGAGCKKSAEEESLVSVEEAGLLSDDEDADGGTADGTKDNDGNTKEETKESSKEGSEAEPADMDEPGFIYVDVRGQVKNPGVYQLPGGSRIYEAIERAGGMTKEAAEASLNQAEKLTDGQQIYVLSKDEQETARESGVYPANAAANTDASAAKNSAGAGASGDGKVNLNTAMKEELMTLTGVGEVKADSIIRYREEHGAFQSVEDVKKIEGIKDGVFNKIKDQITV